MSSGMISEEERNLPKNRFLTVIKKAAVVAKKNVIVVFSVIAALVTCFFVPPDKGYLSYINWKTILCLLTLMMLVLAIQNTRAFTILAAAILKKIRNMRALVTFLVFMPAALALVMTNDVAIVTFVPFTIVLLQMCRKEKHMPKTIILLTLGCNLSTILSPIGTPQNLFLFDHYQLSPFWFAANLWPLAVVGYGTILLFCLLTPKEEIAAIDTGKRSLPKLKLTLFLLLFVFIVLAIFDFVKVFKLYYVAVPVVLVALLIFDRSVFIKTKYSIIIMFTAFFILAGNLARIEVVNNFLTNILAGNEFVIGVGLSQIASNTTAALLLPKFTANYYAFITSACVSKFGTPISTMSNFMVNKFYSKHDEDKSFTKKFYLVQFGFLAIMFATGLLMVYFLQPYQVRL